jgi:hypothetical protein
MTDEPRETELEDQDGEVLPNREVMSVISTDPSDVLVVPGDEMSIQPVQDPVDPEYRTLPVEPRGT